ncbi:MAG TPA: serine hydrolase [Pirellulales bacterium]|jgi:CubicO group peptidase (beta-lactamase class C family)
MKSLLSLLIAFSLSRVANAEDPAPKTKITQERLKTALIELEKLAEKTLNTTGVPGIAIAVVHRDQVVFQKGFGVREAGKSDPIDADTVFQIASLSKPISSTVLAALVGEGKIDWDNRVIDHDPGFRMFDPWTTRELRLRDLLCHRSSLHDHCGDLLEDIGYDRSEILRRLRFQPPASSFRSQYAYTNFGYSEAAVAAAKAVGESWEELAKKKLFEPLGMKSTSARYADYANAKNRVLLHVRVDGKWIAKNVRQPDAQAPAGGVSSTLRDLCRWLRLQLNGGKFEGRQLVAAEALAETHKPQFVLGFSPDRGRLSSYGLGWNVNIERGGKAVWKHSGAFSLGVRSTVGLIPSEELAIVVLSNAAPTGVPEGIMESFFDLALDGKLERDWIEFANRMFDEEIKKELGAERDYSHPPERPTSALGLANYTGNYANDFFGEIEVAEKDSALVLRLGPKKMEFALRHWDRDAFIYQPTGEMAGGLSGVRFSVAPDGKADRVLIENLDIHGQGGFARIVPKK